MQIEITTKVIRRAVGEFGEETAENQKHKFQGLDLMLSLGSVLSGAVPLLLNQDRDAAEFGSAEASNAPADIPRGAQIIRAVRAYFALVSDGTSASELSTAEVFERLRGNEDASYDPEILDTLERTVSQFSRTQEDLRTQEDEDGNENEDESIPELTRT